MALYNFFRQKKPRGFNYVPRYYDPVKEDHEQRLRAGSRETEPEGNEEASAAKDGNRIKNKYKTSIHRGSMRETLTRNRQKAERNNIMAIIVILLLLLFTVIIYFRL